MGSIKSTIDEKKQFAVNSGDFNLRSKIFCDLFPECVEEIKTLLKQRQGDLPSEKAELKPVAEENGGEAASLDANVNPEPEGGMPSLFVLIGIVAFGIFINSLMSA